MPSPTPGHTRRRSPPAITALLPRLRAAAGPTTPHRLLLQSMAVVLTSGLSSSHPALASRLLNSLLPHVPARRLPALLRLLPPDHLTLLLLSSAKQHRAHSLPDACALHALAVSSGHLPSDLRLANSLLSLYLSHGSTASARRLLADIPRPDTVTWNTLLRSCLRMGLLPAARRLFDEMPERDLFTYNSMLSGYVAEGDMANARELFDGMPERDVVTWNSMLAGYTQRGDMENAKKMFDVMPVRDVVSWNSMLDGYAQTGDIQMARMVFDGMPRRSTVSWNVILALYAKVKDWRECLNLFDAMMAVGESKPNEKTFVSILTACGNLGDLERGRWVHRLVRERWERLIPDVLLHTAMLTMYSKCGVMGTAKEIFDSMTVKSVASWNSMIIGYGLHGHSEKALELFMEMEKNGPQPNETTFICILSSCAHGGLVLEGWWCFDRMVRFYNIGPKAEHFGCMMDLLGRAGLLRDSDKLIKNLQEKVSPALWGALISASRTQDSSKLGEFIGTKLIEMKPTEFSDKLIKNLQAKVSPALWGALISASRTQDSSKLGEFIGTKLIEMKPTEFSSYVLLSNIYAAEGRWDDVEKVRKVMKEKVVEKDVGMSLVRSSEPGHVAEDDILYQQNSVMLSLLGEMGVHVKQPSDVFNYRRERN